MSTMSPAGWVYLRRRLYVTLVSLGLLGLTAAVAVDAETSLFGGVAPVSVEPVAGVPLTNGQAMDGFGAWSPDGKQIAFMRDGQIWLMPSGGGEPKQLTSNASVWDAVPAWRPKGKEIAYARMTMSGDAAYLMLIDPATGKETELAKESQPVGHVAWDPSGSLLYYSTPQRLMKLDVKRKKAAVVLALKGDWEMQAGGLAVSRDGKQAIYGAGPSVGRSVRYDLWLIPLSGKEQEPVRLTSAGGIMPTYDPTGKRIAYRNPRQGTGIYLMDLGTHATTNVVPDAERIMHFHPAFSPDGKRLLISQLLVGSDNGQGRFSSHLHVHTLTGLDGQ